MATVALPSIVVREQRARSCEVFQSWPPAARAVAIGVVTSRNSRKNLPLAFGGPLVKLA
jgi:hypothetical protein